MALTRQAKKELVKQATEKLGKQKSVVFTLYQGLKASEITALRKQLTAAGCEYQVLKNKLLGIALKEAGIDASDLDLTGPLAIAYSYEDEVAAAKVISDFAKDHEALEIKAGVLENKLLTDAEVKSLASLPSKDELIVKTIYTIKAPATNFVGALKGTSRKFVRALNLIAEKQEA